MQEILKFIQIFKSPSNEVLFQDCACYWFAHILHQRFSSSSIVYDPDRVHFATRIKGRVYDITGQIEDDSTYIEWSEYKEYSWDAAMIEECCIYLRGGEYCE